MIMIQRSKFFIQRIVYAMQVNNENLKHELEYYCFIHACIK